MSLLNDMLRDLVHQQKLLVERTQDQQEFLPQTPWFKSSAFTGLLGVGIFVSVFCAVLAIKHFFYPAVILHENPIAPLQSATRPDHEIRVPAVPAINKDDVLNEKNVETQAVESVAHVTAASAINASDSEQPVQSLQLQQRIEDLLQQAQRALAVDKLTSPIEDNAYGYYQKILLLEPNHAQAQEGLTLIAARYLAKAREQLTLGNRQQADTFMKRAHFVAPDFFRQHDFLSAEKFSEQDQPTLETRSLVASESFDAPSARIPVVDATSSTTPSTTPSTTQSQSIKPFPVTEAASVNVVPNAVWKDEKVSQEAQELLRQGKDLQALNLLKNFVANELKPTQSALLLATIYLQQGDIQAAEIVINHAEYWSVVEKAKINAQLFVARGDDAAAIHALEEQLSAAENNEPYRALLASLYHKTGQYSQSIVNYQRLLSSFGEKPAYWLGLALAFDGLQQYKNALQAYRHLREFPQLQQQVKTYADQRISALHNE